MSATLTFDPEDPPSAALVFLETLNGTSAFALINAYVSKHRGCTIRFRNIDHVEELFLKFVGVRFSDAAAPDELLEEMFALFRPGARIAGTVVVTVSEKIVAEVDCFAVACPTCGTSDLPLKMCTSCRAYHFCSKECAKAGWPTHKGACHFVQRMKLSS